MEKITITRGLAELKLLDARIKKEIDNTSFVDVYQNRSNKALAKNMTKDDFEKQAKSNLESIQDLIKRRNKIKSEILKSNSITKVKISEKEYLVVEAIDKKTNIIYEQKLLSKMREQYTNALNQIQIQKTKLDSDVQNMLTQNLGTDKKANKDDWDSIAKPFIEQNELKILDPLFLDKKISNLDKEIDLFLNEVDFVLSESNSKTEIEI